MKRAIIYTSAALLAFIFILAACSKKSSGDVSADVCAAVAAKFTADLLPLMQTKCSFNSNCHGTGSTNTGGVLVTYAQISAKSATIKSQVAAGIMPQSGSLTSAQKNTIICWVNNGALNN